MWHFVKKALDFFLPPQCPGCKTQILEPHTLCPSCWGQVHFMTGPKCLGCATPYPFLEKDVDSCTECEGKNFAFDFAQSATIYNTFTKGLILRLKYADATYLSPLFARWIEKLPLPSNCLLIPVPLHWTRLIKRQFNQAALIAIHLRKYKGHGFFINHAPILKRQRRTKAQGKQGAEERFDNLKGAFYVPEKAKPFLKGKTVILIDDVLTSGATAHACATALKKAGCSCVYVITVARVVRAQEL